MAWGTGARYGHLYERVSKTERRLLTIPQSICKWRPAATLLMTGDLREYDMANGIGLPLVRQELFAGFRNQCSGVV